MEINCHFDDKYNFENITDDVPTVLHLAIINGKIEIAEALIAACKDDKFLNHSALFKASEYNFSGEKIDRNMDAISLADFLNRYEILKTLKDKNETDEKKLLKDMQLQAVLTNTVDGDISWFDNLDEDEGFTLLHLAIYLNRVQIAKLLIATNTDENYINALVDQEKLLEWLKSSPEEKGNSNFNNMDAIKLAVYFNRREIVTALNKDHVIPAIIDGTGRDKYGRDSLTRVFHSSGARRPLQGMTAAS